MSESDSHVGNHAQIAAKIVCRLPPQVRSLTFQGLDFKHAALEVPDVTQRFLLLQLEVLADAFFDSGAAQGSPDLACSGHCLVRDAGVLTDVAFQLRHHALIQLPQLPGDLRQVVSLLPPLQAVRRCRRVRGLLLEIPCMRAEVAQLALERTQQRGNMVVKVNLRQGIAAGKSGIPCDCGAPSLQYAVAPGAQIACQGIKL